MLYIDVFFLLNFYMDLLVLLITGNVRRKQPRVPRYLLSAGIGALWACIIVVWRALPWWVGSPVSYAGISLLMCKAAWRLKGRKESVFTVAVLYGVTWALGGALNALYYSSGIGVYFRRIMSGEDHVVALLWLICAAALISGAFILSSGIYKRYQAGKTPIVGVKLYFGDKTVETRGLLDTGNRLCTPGGTPVHLIDKTLVEKLFLESEQAVLTAAAAFETLTEPDVCQGAESAASLAVQYIPYQSVGRQRGLLPVVFLDKMVIIHDSGEEQIPKPAVGISDACFSLGKEYQMILHVT